MSKLIDLSYTATSVTDSGFNAEVYGDYKLPAGKELSFGGEMNTVHQIFNDATVLILNAAVYIGSLHKQLAYGKELIVLLKKEYRLD